MNLYGQFVRRRHDHDLSRCLRRIDARKEGQEVSQRLTGTRLCSQVRVLPGNERRDCGDLNGAGVEYLLFRERSDEFGWQRQIGKRHEFETRNGSRQHAFFSHRMSSDGTAILTALWRQPSGRVTRRRLP
jgi:hypothetical protein